MLSASNETFDDFPQTCICSQYTIWETDFERSVSQKDENYSKKKDALSRQGIKSKPMVARALAKSCSRSDLSKELDCCLMDIIEKVKAVKCMDRAIVNERPKNVAQFDLHDEKTDNSYPVFLCAAGRGLTIEDDKPWKHAVHHDDLLRLKDDDFFVLIMGDSMSPRIPNGAIIAVRRQDTIDPDGIGIFDINNEETMCKRLIERKNDGVRLLRSCNQDGERFPDIVLNESTTARCRGRVLINPSSRKPFMWFPQTERKDIP